MRPHHETNDDDEAGGMRKGGNDETEGETKAECESTTENEGRTRERKGDKKGGQASLKIPSRRERRMREKELTVMVVATSPGSGRWLKNEVIW